MKTLATFLIVSFCAFYSLSAFAVLNVRVTQSANDAQPIAVVPFGWTQVGEQPPMDIARVISDDLKRSGQFKPLPDADMLAQPVSGQLINFANWRSVNVDHVVVGKLRKEGADCGAVVTKSVFQNSRPCLAYLRL